MPKNKKPEPDAITISIRLDPESQRNLAAVEGMLSPGPARGRTSAAVRHALAIAAATAKPRK